MTARRARLVVAGVIVAVAVAVNVHVDDQPMRSFAAREPEITGRVGSCSR